mmetsp:Transcript_81563/g.231143  ORF Transcript_81563/g.231143 Transcript_81563/m.231143 type:complete len:238 (+) Transcript_81563:1055-1768(+)
MRARGCAVLLVAQVLCVLDRAGEALLEVLPQVVPAERHGALPRVDLLGEPGRDALRRAPVPGGVAVHRVHRDRLLLRRRELRRLGRQLRLLAPLPLPQPPPVAGGHARGATRVRRARAGREPGRARAGREPGRERHAGVRGLRARPARHGDEGRRVVDGHRPRLRLHGHGLGGRRGRQAGRLRVPPPDGAGEPGHRGGQDHGKGRHASAKGRLATGHGRGGDFLVHPPEHLLLPGLS